MNKEEYAEFIKINARRIEEFRSLTELEELLSLTRAYKDEIIPEYALTVRNEYSESLKQIEEATEKLRVAEALKSKKRYELNTADSDSKYCKELIPCIEKRIKEISAKAKIDEMVSNYPSFDDMLLKRLELFAEKRNEVLDFLDTQVAPAKIAAGILRLLQPSMVVTQDMQFW